MKKIVISAALATYNEEDNIGSCLKSIEDFVDEVVIVDGSSTDKTVAVAQKMGAKVSVANNPAIFHINKQKALDLCRGKWILQLDADERVTPELAHEISQVVSMSDRELDEYQDRLVRKKLFDRHRRLLEKRDGKIGGKTGRYAGFFIPRLNYFMGKYLRYGGVYPDGVIRLVRNGQAKFPCRSVHEQIEINGRVGWLQNSLIHMADPTFRRYLSRNSRYIDLMVDELAEAKTGKEPIQLFLYFFVRPLRWFFSTLVGHKGFLDGWCGVIFSFFSAMRFPRAYWRYLFKG